MMYQNKLFALYCLLSACCMGVCLPVAQADEDLPLHPVLQSIADADVYRVQLTVDLGDGKPATWTLTPTETEVLLAKLASPPKLSHPLDALYAEAVNPLPTYQGVDISFETYHKAELPALRVFNTRVLTAKGGSLLRPDAGRELELWLFGTAQYQAHRLLAVQAVPIFTFEQCVGLGNQLVDSAPRQCVLPDNNLLLESLEPLSVADLAIVDFDTCLKDGKALIDAFPRRCLARGGRVFTEPPRLIEYEVERTREVDLDAFIQEMRSQPPTPPVAE